MLYTLCNFIISNTGIFYTVPFRIFMLCQIIPFMLCVIIPFMLCHIIHVPFYAVPIVPFNSLSHRACISAFLILQCDIQTFLYCVIFYLYMRCYSTLLCCALCIVPFHIVLHCTLLYCVIYVVPFLWCVTSYILMLCHIVLLCCIVHMMLFYTA